MSTAENCVRAQPTVVPEILVELIGIEPTTPCLQSRCSPKLSYSPGVGCVASLLIDLWWVWMDSNHRPPPYQDGALTN